VATEGGLLPSTMKADFDAGNTYLTFDITDVALTANTQYGFLLMHDAESSANMLLAGNMGSAYGDGIGIARYNRGTTSDAYSEAMGWNGTYVPLDLEFYLQEASIAITNHSGQDGVTSPWIATTDQGGVGNEPGMSSDDNDYGFWVFGGHLYQQLTDTFAAGTYTMSVDVLFRPGYTDQAYDFGLYYDDGQTLVPVGTTSGPKASTPSFENFDAVATINFGDPAVGKPILVVLSRDGGTSSWYDNIRLKGPDDKMLPNVDAGSDWVTWTGQAVTLDDVFVENNDPGDPQSDLLYTWTADPDGLDDPDFSVTITENDDPNAPTILITKDTEDAPAVISIDLTLAVNNEGSGSADVTDTLTIEVYDDQCQAARIGMELAADNPGDLDGNCTTDLGDVAILASMWLIDADVPDLAEMAETWLDDYSLTEPDVKPIPVSKALVFLIAGQSNAGGVAYFYPSDNPPSGNGAATTPGSTAEEVGIPLTAAGYPKSDFWNGSSWIDIIPGSGNYGTGYSDPYRHGIELPMAMLLEEAYPQDDKFIIKHGPGGTNLHTQWKAKTGPEYVTFMNYYNAAIQNLQSRYDVVEVIGLYWDQGESDEPQATAYKQNLLDLFAAFREDTEIPDMQIYVRKHLFQYDYPDFQPIITAQVEVTADDPNAHLLDLDLGSNDANFQEWAWIYDNGHLSSEAFLELSNRIKVIIDQ
jgi:hypothetical protein